MAGIPVLGMLDGEGAFVIDEANAGLTCGSGDGAGLAHAILSLASMTSVQRAQLGLNGRKYAQQEFGRAQLMDRIESLLTEAVVTIKTNV